MTKIELLKLFFIIFRVWISTVFIRISKESIKNCLEIMYIVVDSVYKLVKIFEILR